MNHQYFFNVTKLCGIHNWTIWNDETNDFGQCFFSLAILCPSHAILAIASAYFIGLGSRPYYLRTQRQKWILYTRSVATLLLAVVPMISVIFRATYVNFDIFMKYDGWAKLVEPGIQVFSWLTHFIYIIVLLERISPSTRGKRSVLFIFVMVAIIDCLQCRTLITRRHPYQKLHHVMEATAIVELILIAIYILTLIPVGDDSESHYEELLTNESSGERTSLLRNANYSRMNTSTYGGFNDDNSSQDPNYLGIAKQNDSWLSILFFYWVTPLIKKGKEQRIKTPEDVFDVPADVATALNSDKFQETFADPRIETILKALYKIHGKQFFGIGVLKFIADCSGFAAPLLLNLVVNFMENPSADRRWGYVYAMGLTLSTFAVSLCNAHFNLLINELKLKVRASLITSVYKHVISVSSLELNQFSTGEVINYMSTDVDRIVNFGPSLHAVWSLPFQLLVTIALLYQQLGVSSLAGVGITILMIPLNKYVADKIGSLSTQMMKAKDSRVQIMSEILSGIRVIKYFGWEPYFAQKVFKSREEELKHLKGRKYLDAVCVYLWATTPVLISVVSFAIFALLKNQLTAANVFTSVALFAMLTGPLNAFPWALNGLVESFVSLKRVDKFLKLSTFNDGLYYSDMNEIVDAEIVPNTVLALSKAVFSHNSDPILNESEFHLDRIDFMVKRGQLIGIIGKVGSGKSSLLASILGELNKVSGHTAVEWPYSGIGFVQQEPWLQKGSVRDNILFGKLYQSDWYQTVIEACALKEDLRQWYHGDQTNVGENGAMLSGGQKARVALARAVYQDKEVYLIDDIFSALDVPVAMQIYKYCIQGLLKRKTRIICTHHPRFLSNANEIFVLENGKFIEQGGPTQVLSKISHQFRDDIDSDRFHRRTRNRLRQLSTSTDQGDSGDSKRRPSLNNAQQNDANEETSETGVVSAKVYLTYWNAIGHFLGAMILLSMILMQFTRNYTDIWLADWVSQNTTEVTYYLEIYGSIAVANSIFSLIRAFLFAYGGICAAKILHKRLLNLILKAKAFFFDNTPTGRILNRFSSDLYTVDDSLPFILNILLAQIFGVVGPILVCVYAVPWITLLLVPLAFILFDIQQRYRPASRDLKRIGSISLSPIYSQFSETLSGLKTIRAMKSTQRFIRENEEFVESSQRAQYASFAASQWLEFKLQMLGCAVVTGIAILAVIQHGSQSVSPGLVGLAISYALGITGKLSGLVSAFTETEREFVAVERCKQYLDDIQIEDFDGGVTTTPYNWPSEGILVFKDVSFRYGEYLPLALKDLSFETKGREKVGIVGRTGSGKSSIFQVLFRTADLVNGEVTIDGVNINLLNLAELRSILTIIPQKPFLFKGSVKENVDPLGKHSDLQIWDVLRKSHLVPMIDRLGGLDGLIEDSGRNLSVGQRQLLCLSRAILSSAKIVCVDEATANVDLETDRLVQDVLRTALHNCTVITIAHRVETVMGSDRVIVMSTGQAIEVGHPNILLQDPKSKFSQHCDDNR